MGFRLILYQIVDVAFMCYIFMLIARIVGSWFVEWRHHAIFRFICFYTDPYLNVFRRIIPPIGMLDISPIVAFFALRIIESVVKRMIFLI